MAVEIVSKTKKGLACADCGASLTSGEACEEHPDAEVKKSLVIVRKAVGDNDDDLDAALEVEDEVDDDDEEDDDDEIDDELDEDDEDDEDEEDEDEVVDEDEKELATVGKSVVGLEALNIATAFVSDVVKCFKGGKFDSDKYEETMTEFNNVFDAAADTWSSGSAVSKSSKKSHLGAIAKRVTAITKEEGKKMPRPKTLKFDELPDDVKDYISTLEGDDVEKSQKITKRADLPADVRKSLEEADKIVERDKVSHWEGIAKGYTHFPGDKQELAKTLRALSESNPKAFEEMQKTLDAAQENLKQSDIFKSHGLPGGGNPDADPKKSEIEELIKKSNGELTYEQAAVQLMDGSSYKSTVTA